MQLQLHLQCIQVTPDRGDLITHSTTTMLKGPLSLASALSFGSLAVSPAQADTSGGLPICTAERSRGVRNAPSMTS